MKLYKLRFTGTDFVNKSGNVWRTGVIDLYNNAQYKNYSARKAPKGTDLLGDGTYTGLNSADGVTSEIGFVDSGRFVDTSGRIDIISWKGTFSQPAGGETDISLNVYTTDKQGLTPYYSHATPSSVGDWAVRSSLAPGDLVLSIGSYRYIFFEIELASESPISPSADVELIVSVEINPPVVNGFFDGTRRALDKFPEWMEMREHNPSDLTDSLKATPNTVGGSFINAVAGEWLGDLRSKITYQEFQRYIENVDISQKAWVYRTSDIPVDVFSVTHGGGNTQTTYTSSAMEFYGCDATEDATFHNQDTREIYSNKLYAEGTFKVNGVAVTQEAYQVWNALDDLGVNVDLFRLPMEDNDSFKKRILDVYISKPGVSSERFKTSLRRELNLWKYFGATPDSYYAGATPEVLDIEHIENSLAYFTADGNPTEKFYILVERLAKKYPMTWGLFRYGEALWDSDGLYHKGFSTIPKIYDATPVTDEQYQSGVGDINDLHVFGPDFYQPDQTFDVKITARGRKPVTSPTLTEIPFEALVVGIAKDAVVSYGAADNKFHLKAVVDGVTYYANISLSAAYYGGDPDIINLYSATPSGTWPPPANVNSAIGYYDWMGSDGYTSSALEWRNQSGNAILEGRLPLASITSLSLFSGYKDTFTGVVSQIPSITYYKAKFVGNAATLGNNTAGTSITAATPASFTTTDWRVQYEYWNYTAQSDATQGYRSIAQPISGTINAGDVNKSYVVTIGNFDFPTYNGPSSDSHKIEVRLSEKNDLGVYGAFTKSGLFIPATSIFVNGSNAWVNGVLTLNVSTVAVGGTVTLTFTCTTATGYPENKNVWQSFKETYTPIPNQKINEHGPYRYGQPPQVGNKDNTVKTFRLNYTDFGLVGTTEEITWIGIESVNNPNVLVWTDTNSVIPVGANAADYPSGSLVETISTVTNKKVLSPLRVSAKVKSNLNPKWNPYVHSGWFYENQQEYYLFAEPETATVTSGQSELLLLSKTTPTQAYQGAPIIAWTTATPRQLRQIPNADSATPPNSYYVTETKTGTSLSELYVGYANVTDVTVKNLTLNTNTAIVSTSSSTNKIVTTLPTSKSHEFEIKYKVRDSFYVDNSTLGQTKVHFTATPGSGNNYIVTWENSAHNPATPVEIPLNPLYSSMDEGFLYIDQDEHNLSFLEISVSPSAIMATPGDYTMVSVYAYDSNGNPKPNVKFAINDFAGLTPTLATPAYVTDAFGHAAFYMNAKNNSTSGRIRVNAKLDNTGGYTLPGGSWTPGQNPATPMMTENNNSASPNYVSAEAQLDVTYPPAKKHKITAVMDSNQVIGDGRTATYVFGYVRDTNDNGVPYAVVYWRKGRNLKSVLNETAQSTSSATPGASLRAGRIVADVNGRFSIGPFVSSTTPGYWLLSVESSSASPTFTPQFPTVGDITYWYEYLNVTNMLDTASLLPYFSTQASTPSYKFKDFMSTPAFPVTLDERYYMGTPSHATPNWLPPTWYPISRYDQYQLGLMGNAYYTVTKTTPDFNDQVES